MSLQHFLESCKYGVPLYWYTNYNKPIRQELFQLVNSESDYEMYSNANAAGNLPKNDIHSKGVVNVFV